MKMQTYKIEAMTNNYTKNMRKGETDGAEKHANKNAYAKTYIVCSKGPCDCTMMRLAIPDRQSWLKMRPQVSRTEAVYRWKTIMIANF
jgi:hypothetical protein